MAEKEKLFVKTLSYEGLLDYTELFRIVDHWLRDRFYDKRESRMEEKETEKGKIIDFKLEPWKKVTDYFKIILKFEWIVGPLKEVEVEKEGKKLRIDKGQARLKLTGYLIYDYENKWTKPLQYFLRYLFDHFIYWPVTKKYKDMVREHSEDICGRLARYLKIEKY